MKDANSTEVADTENRPDELTLLKQRADMMGISYNSRIGVDALSAKITRALDGVKADDVSADAADEEEEDEDEDDEEEEVVRKPKVKKTAVRQMTEIERKAKVRADLQADQMRLVRLRITNLNPGKKDVPGEIFTVANKYLGIVKKYIPYGEVTENGYHVPWVIYQQMKDRQFLNIRVRKNQKTGEDVIEQNWVKEFALEVLDPLTPGEIATLAAAQSAAGGVN